MCAGDFVRSRVPPPGVEGEVELFARVLREVFHDAPWADVERSARGAWRHIGQITGHDWEDVRDSVQRAWQLH